MKNFITITSLLFTASVTLISCNDSFLDRPPLDEVISDMYFEKPQDLEIYMNQYYSNSFFPKYANHGNDYDSDNLVSSTVNTRLQGTRTVSVTGSIGFGNVRSLNYFLNNYFIFCFSQI